MSSELEFLISEKVEETNKLLRQIVKELRRTNAILSHAHNVSTTSNNDDDGGG